MIINRAFSALDVGRLSFIAKVPWKISACEAGLRVKPGVKRSGTPGYVVAITPAREAGDSAAEIRSCRPLRGL